MACSAKMPKSRRRSSLFFRIRSHHGRNRSASRCTLWRRGLGTNNSGYGGAEQRQADHEPEDARDPDEAREDGPATSATMNDVPMVMPTIAIALVRLSSVVRSATSANITAPTAPAPCSTRPTMTPSIECRDGSHRAADPEHDESEDDHDFSPDLVGQEAERDLQKSLAQSIDAERQTDLVRLSPPTVAEHRPQTPDKS